jgi:hypothetical protein
MTPESIQAYVLFLYSVFFLGLALVLWRVKIKKSYDLTEYNPCPSYLKMRWETSKLLDSREFSELKNSMFEVLTLEMR